jgi:hypothetical protein
LTFSIVAQTWVQCYDTPTQVKVLDIQ